MKAFDVDVQILGFAVPLILPEDFTLSIGHTYVRPIAFREDNVINYTNTPSLNLSKNIPLSNGDIITMNVGISYSFSESDTLEEQIADPAYYNFIKAVMNSNGLILSHLNQLIFKTLGHKWPMFHISNRYLRMSPCYKL